MIKELLTEKLRPKKFEHLILSERIKKELNGGTVSQNLILTGPAGTGKTSAAKILATGHPSLYINISDESSVDVIRTKITDFCSTMSAMDEYEDGKPRVKVVILDEVDGASDQFFKALRGTIEKFAHNARFIATCNYENKIPDEIMSRFQRISFDLANDAERDEIFSQWKSRAEIVLKKLGINYTDGALSELVSRTFPDLRSLLNKIQGYNVAGITELTLERVKSESWDFEDVYKILVKEPSPVETYQLVVSEYANKVESLMSSFGNNFISWLMSKHPDKAQAIPQVIVAVAHHQSQRVHVIDPVVSLLSLCFTIQKYLSSAK
jgi:DNA polymerase III delta prime subunit